MSTRIAAARTPCPPLLIENFPTASTVSRETSETSKLASCRGRFASYKAKLVAALTCLFGPADADATGNLRVLQETFFFKAMTDLHTLLIAFGSFVWLHRLVAVVSKRSCTYRSLTVAERFDWEARVVNSIVQFLQTCFNLYILFWDGKVAEDYVRSYSETFHIGAVVIAAFYMYDAAVLTVNPKSSLISMWLTHHMLCIALLTFNFDYRAGAFPSSSFLISSAGHVPAELRWLAYHANYESILLFNLLHVACFVCMTASHVAAPIYMMYSISAQRGLSLRELLFDLMHWPCLVGSAIILIPHVGICVVQLQKAIEGWNKGNSRLIKYEKML